MHQAWVGAGPEPLSLSLLGCWGTDRRGGTAAQDPVLIISQIVALQCLWYITLCCLVWLLLGGPQPDMS